MKGERLMAGLSGVITGFVLQNSIPLTFEEKMLGIGVVGATFGLTFIKKQMFESRETVKISKK